ncbi:MAG: hypothetical protein E7618_05260 [Ruminococcaceae bacterium]|nr:hypothetical protein [Oscillospiraceae bacterium]
MKKFLFFVLSALLLLSSSVAALAADEYEAKTDDLSAYGQKTHAANYIASVPDIDGKVEEGEYGEALHILNGYDANDKSQYWNGMQENDRFKIADTVPEKATLYMAYDETSLYIAAVVVDDNHYTPGEGEAIWDGDYLEFDVGFRFDGTADGMLDRVRLAFGISNSNTPYSYVATASSYCQYPVLSEIAGFAATRNESSNTTVYEAELPWKDLTGSDEVPERGFFMYQLGVAHSDLKDLAVANSTKAYLGCLRYAALIPAGVIADSAKIGMHIFTVDKTVLPTTEPPATEPPVTNPPATEPPATQPVVTEPAATEPAVTEPTTTAPVTTEPAGNEGGVNPIAIILIVAGVAIVAIVVVTMLKIKKAK